VTLAATFLGGAKSRLLPAFVPFRFFIAAALFHIALWAVLLLAGGDTTSFRGSLGPTLAAVHLLTLGVLTVTAVGAAVQLLPVATRRALVAVWPIKLVFWLLVPGLIVLVVGMYAYNPATLIVGAVAASAGLLIFAGLLAGNLRGGGSLAVVAAYGWAAFVALIALVALGLALSFDFEIGFFHDHAAVALAHMIVASFGFMGMLALGFSHVLVPMFALSAAPAKRPAYAAFAAAIVAIALAAGGAAHGNRLILTIAGVIGIGAVLAHLWLMQHALKTGMRKRLGLSFVLVRAAWAALLLTPFVGLAALYDLAGPNGATLFGLVALGGWLMTFLFGILQRIIPFLASMHVTQPKGAPPLLSELASDVPLTVHAVCHGIAIVALAVAIVLDNGWIARGAAAVGLIGAVALAVFTADVARRLIGRRTEP
jgi:hypothetical protein